MDLKTSLATASILSALSASSAALALPSSGGEGQPFAGFLVASSSEDEAHAGHAGHAGHEAVAPSPAGVMTGHHHGAGEWMISYRYMRMEMDGNRDGTSSVSNADIFAQGFMVAPTSMSMGMHMIGAMYGLTDQTTVMAMIPYREISMLHRTGTGVRFSTESEGLGDIRLGGLFTLWSEDDAYLKATAGLSLPTGSISVKDRTPMGRQRLPYPMQLGSGTWDVVPGLAYLQEGPEWSWGLEATQMLRMGENHNDYRLGNQTEVGAWVARSLGGGWSASLRLAGRRWGDVHGADPQLNPAVVPTARPDLRGGKRLDVLAGIDYHAASGGPVGNRIFLEAGAPIWQDLDGPQLETDFLVTIGWQVITH